MKDDKCKKCNFKHIDHDVKGFDYNIHYCPICQEMTYNDFYEKIRAVDNNEITDLYLSICRKCKVVKEIW